MLEEYLKRTHVQGAVEFVTEYMGWHTFKPRDKLEVYALCVMVFLCGNKEEEPVLLKEFLEKFKDFSEYLKIDNP